MFCKKNSLKNAKIQSITKLRFSDIQIESNENIDNYKILFQLPCVVNIGRLEKQKNYKELLAKIFQVYRISNQYMPFLSYFQII